MTAIREWLAAGKSWLIAAGGAVIALFWAFWKGKNDGIREERTRQVDTTLQTAKKALDAGRRAADSDTPDERMRDKNNRNR